MLSIQQIHRLIHQQQFRQLAQRILENGRCGDVAICRRLVDSQPMIPIALGLALQRCTELTYRPTAVADALALRLLDQQRSDGLFGRHARPQNARGAIESRDDRLARYERAIEPPLMRGTPAEQSERAAEALRVDDVDGATRALAPTAVALRGLIDYAHQRSQLGLDVPVRVRRAIERAVQAITLQTEQGDGHRLGIDEMDGRIVRWQLDDPALHSRRKRAELGSELRRRRVPGTSVESRSTVETDIAPPLFSGGLAA